jgi:hypothetical protein
MTARFDKAQGFQFYYGNALRDLSHFVPQEKQEISDSNESQESSSLETQMGVINSLLDQSLLHLNNLQNSKRQLRFLLADLKRMIG